MSKRLLVVNLVLAAIAVFFAVSLIRSLTHATSLPPPPAPRQTAATLPASAQGAAPAVPAAVAAAG